MSPICPGPLCHQFWKDGNYDSGLISKSSSKNSSFKMLDDFKDDFKNSINDEFRQAFIAGVADDTGYRWAIAKSLDAAGAIKANKRYTGSSKWTVSGCAH
ncbi:hypothetical protein KY289_023100 [Solanum tuberosum]|nr:hypothetical protein KY289_023100 [Solanum tuberosum]